MAQSLALLEPKSPPGPGGPAPGGVGAGPNTGFKLFGKDGLSFDDILDTVNPLHHLPIVGFIYRAVTGDTISPASRITGGALFGGPLGLAASVADTMLKEASGRDTGGHLLALVEGRDTEELFPQLKPDTQPDAHWEKVSVLRHDAQEFDDWRPLAPGPETAAAATAKAPERPVRSFAAASLRYDSIDTVGAEHDPAPAAPAKDAAVAAPTTLPAAASIAPRPGKAPGKAHPAGANGPVAGAAATPLGPPAAAGSRFPSARVLAANPAMVSTLRKSESPYFRPGGTLNSDSWLKLMNNAGANRKSGAPPTGAGSLSSATIAKALAKYGAAAQNPAAAPGK
jgi:hypothetical protein